MHQGGADDHADAVENATHDEKQNREPKYFTQAEADYTQAETGDHPEHGCAFNSFHRAYSQDERGEDGADCWGSA